MRRKADALALSALRLVEALGDRDLLGEDFDLVLDARTPVIERVDEFLEVEQPERQLERRGADDVGARTEAAAVFVVAVEQEDAQIGPRVEDLVDQHGDAARLADAGRAEDGEVLAEQIVDVDGGVDGLVVMQRADCRSSCAPEVR